MQQLVEPFLYDCFPVTAGNTNHGIMKPAAVKGGEFLQGSQCIRHQQKRRLRKGSGILGFTDNKMPETGII